MPSRRALLGALGLATTTTIAGCFGGNSGADGVDLTVFNQTATPYTVEIAFFEAGASERSARASDASLDIDPGGETTREAVVATGRYLVRYDVYAENSELTDEDHVHFIPAGDGTETLTFDIRDSGELYRR